MSQHMHCIANLCWQLAPIITPSAVLLTSGDRRTAPAHDGWEVDLDFMLDDGDGEAQVDAAADAEQRGALGAVAAPTGASSPGSSQYGSASEGGAYADGDEPMPMSPAELNSPPPSGVRRFAAVAANNGGDIGLESAPVGSPVGVARQLGGGVMLLGHPGTAINVPLTQVAVAATTPPSLTVLLGSVCCLVTGLFPTPVQLSGRP